MSYAIKGFVDLLREQLMLVRYHQILVAWESYIREVLGKETGSTPRLNELLIMLSVHPATPKSKLSSLSPSLARAYANRTDKTLTRDLNKLKAMDLIELTPKGIRAKIEKILAFMPRTKSSLSKKKIEDELKRMQDNSLKLFD
jgi:hypothetical protein